MFFGLGADGTVGANKASVKIIGESTDLWARATSCLRLEEVGVGDGVPPALRPAPIRSTYLVEDADFVAATSSGCSSGCRCSTTPSAAPTFLLNSPYGPDEVWDRLPARSSRS